MQKNVNFNIFAILRKSTIYVFKLKLTFYLFFIVYLLLIKVFNVKKEYKKWRNYDYSSFRGKMQEKYTKKLLQ